MCNKIFAIFFKGFGNINKIPINFNDEIDEIVSVKKMKEIKIHNNKKHLILTIEINFKNRF